MLKFAWVVSNESLDPCFFSDVSTDFPSHWSDMGWLCFPLATSSMIFHWNDQIGMSPGFLQNIIELVTMGWLHSVTQQ